MSEELLINLEGDIAVNLRSDSEEVQVTFSDDIVVKVRQGNEVALELTTQGVQGPRGKDGILTPSLEVARDQALAAAEDAEAALAQLNDQVALADASKVAAAGSASAAAGSATAANTAKVAAETARDASIAAKTASETARDASVNAKTASETARDASVAGKTAAETARDKAKDWAEKATDTIVDPGLYSAKHHATKAAASATAAAGSATAAGTAKTAAETAQGAAVTAKTAAETAKTASETARDLSVAAKVASEAGRDASVAAKVLAETARDAASGSATAANTSKVAAETAKTGAETARTGSETAKTASEAARDLSIAAKTAAETAQGAAVTARTGAETAKTAAETARDAAIAARTGAETAQTGAGTAKTAAETARDAALAAAAVAGGFRYIWSTDTATTDPGTGKLKVNAGNTQLYISETDANGAAMAAVIATWDDSTNTALRSTIKITKVGAPGVFKVYSVIAGLADNGTWDNFNVSAVASNGAFADGDQVVLEVSRTGNVGNTGATGVAVGVSLNYSTTVTDADPGNGIFRFNNASVSQVTQIYIDNFDVNVFDIQAWLDALDDSSSVVKGVLYFKGVTSPAAFAVFKVTGVVVDGTGYRKLNVSYVTHGVPWTNGNNFVVTFSPSGDAGTGAVASVNGQSGTVVLHSDSIDDTGKAHQFVTAADKTKLGFMSVTQAVDLDAVETAALGALQAISYTANTIDLNTVLTPGRYRLGATVTNGPSGANYSQMAVLQGADTCIQIVYPYGGAKVAWRNITIGSPNTYNPWKYFYDSVNMPAIADVTGLATALAAKVDTTQVFNSDGNYLVRDTRNADTPTDIGLMGVKYEFKQKSNTGLPEGGTYHGAITFQPWNDSTGGSIYQLAFSTTGNMFFRTAPINGAWGTWSKFWKSDNFDPATKADVSSLGTAASKNTGTASGNVPILDGTGKLDPAVLPATAIIDTFPVASQAAMLALSAQRGDVAIRSDLSKTFILSTNSPSTLADWKEMLTPTDAVQSVAGLMGTVSAAALKSALSITTADITDMSANGRSLVTSASYAAMKTLLGLDQVSNTSDANKPVSTAQATAIAAKDINVQIAAAASAGLNDGDHAIFRRVSDGVSIKRTIVELTASIATRFGVGMQSAAVKATVEDADQTLIADGSAANLSKRVTFTSVWNYIKGKADTVYPAIASVYPKAEVYSKTEMDTILEDFVPSGGGSGTLDRQYAKWESGATVYTLPLAPASFAFLDVYVGGVIQPKDGSAYSFVGDQLTLVEAPGTEMVEVYVFGPSAPLTTDPDTWLEQIIAAPAQAYTDATMVPGVKGDGTLITRTWANLKADLATIFFPKTGGTINGGITLLASNPTLLLNKLASGEVAVVYGGKAGVVRWGQTLGDGATEAGSNSGSNYVVYRYADDGAFLGTPFWIERATGNVNIDKLSLNGTVVGSALASAANYRANTAGKVLTTDMVWAAGAWVNLPNLTGNVTLDFGSFINGYGSATANFTFYDWTGLKSAQSGSIWIWQAGGTWTAGYNTARFRTNDGKGLTLKAGRNQIAYQLDPDGLCWLSVVATGTA